MFSRVLLRPQFYEQSPTVVQYKYPPLYNLARMANDKRVYIEKGKIYIYIYIHASLLSPTYLFCEKIVIIALVVSSFVLADLPLFSIFFHLFACSYFLMILLILTTPAPIHYIT